MKSLTFGSLFSGIGGIDIGLERAGMDCRWQVEQDDYCNRILAARWPTVRRLSDVQDVQAGAVEATDCICGGFPCQPFSYAGQRRGTADSRWLWPEYARVVDELRPRVVLVENVPGLLTSGGAEVIADLASLGYSAEWTCLSAAEFGAPHRRIRFFLLAYSSLQWDAGGSAFARSSERARNFTWTVEPGVGRMVDGLSNRLDRLRTLGNAVVPQVAEWIGRRIISCIASDDSATTFRA